MAKWVPEDGFYRILGKSSEHNGISTGDSHLDTLIDGTSKFLSDATSPISNIGNNMTTSDMEDFANELVRIFTSKLSGMLNNEEVMDFASQINSKAQEKSVEYQKDLMDYSFNLTKQLRSSAMQDTIEDLKKAGINPAVYFGFGGQANSSQGISAQSVNSASVGTPTGDTMSSVVSAIASIFASIASNENADSAILRQLISSLGSVFSLNSSANNSYIKVDK